EMLIRGTLAYVGLLAILRVFLKRQSADLALSDMLVTVLIADAIQNGMAGEYKSVPDGLVLVSTIVGWDFVVDWLAYKFPAFHRLINPPPMLLIKNGVINHRHLRKEYISMDELKTAMRLEGIDDTKRVKKAFLESDGKISFIK